MQNEKKSIYVYIGRILKEKGEGAVLYISRKAKVL